MTEYRIHPRGTCDTCDGIERTMRESKLAELREKLLEAFDLTEGDIFEIEGDPDVPGTYAYAKLQFENDRNTFMYGLQKVIGFTPEDEPTKEDIIIGLLNQIIDKLDPKVLTSPGGLCAPVRPIYDAMPLFAVERGGITYSSTESWEKSAKKLRKRKGKKKRKVK